LQRDSHLADGETVSAEHTDSVRVQYGCGPGPVPTGWINFDASPTLKISTTPVVGRFLTRRRVTFDRNTRFGDIVKGLPLASESCDAVYSSHVLEHLPRADVRVALDNTFRILRPGGVFRLVLPDLRYLSKEYLEGRLSSDQFVTELHMGIPDGGRRKRLLDAMGNSRHLWMWDETSLAELLSAVGFINVRRATFGDRDDDLFADVEAQDRWTNCLGLQAERPC
jgi:SAM-dependent methyltransferase